jgi:hypothetical protein
MAKMEAAHRARRKESPCNREPSGRSSARRPEGSRRTSARRKPWTIFEPWQLAEGLGTGRPSERLFWMGFMNIAYRAAWPETLERLA